MFTNKLLTDARAYISHNLSHRHGLLAYTSICCPMQKGFSSSAKTNTKKRNRIKPELMEALQILKFSLKKARLDFTSHLQFYEPTSDAGSSNTLTNMLRMKPNALKAFLDAAEFDD